MARVSVLLSVYNGQDYIAAAVESILTQTWTDFEFIIVDDGSTDSTPDILASPPISTDKRVRVIRHSENRGISAAHNTELQAARGELLARIDGDDIAAPERLERQVKYMQTHPNCVQLGSFVEILCPAGLPLFTKEVPTDPEEIARRLWSGDSQAIVHPAAMMRREAVERVGGYRERYSSVEDLDIYLRLLSQGSAGNLPEPLLGYRQHPASTNAQKYETQLQLMRDLMVELDDQCPYEGLERPFLNGWPREARDESYRRWGWNALKHGRIDVARRHAVAAIRHGPASKEAWRLGYCALRGR